MEGAEICARLDPAVPAEPGQALQLAADMSKMHLIEPESGRVV
jgi:multiple sugar transport system ATP-binding protein